MWTLWLGVALACDCPSTKTMATSIASGATDRPRNLVPLVHGTTWWLEADDIDVVETAGVSVPLRLEAEQWYWRVVFDALLEPGMTYTMSFAEPDPDVVEDWQHPGPITFTVGTEVDTEPPAVTTVTSTPSFRPGQYSCSDSIRVSFAGHPEDAAVTEIRVQIGGGDVAEYVFPRPRSVFLGTQHVCRGGGRELLDASGTAEFRWTDHAGNVSDWSPVLAWDGPSTSPVGASVDDTDTDAAAAGGGGGTSASGGGCRTAGGSGWLVLLVLLSCRSASSGSGTRR